MKRIDVGNLVASASNVAMFADKMARATAHLGDRDAMQLDPQDLLRTYLMSLAHMSDTAKWLDLRATAAAAGRCKSAFDRLRATNGVIDKRIANDLVSPVSTVVTVGLVVAYVWRVATWRPARHTPPTTRDT